MNFEDLQKTWQAQPVGARVTITTDTLLKEVRRNQRQFLATIFWRDVREVVACVLLAAYFIHRGWHSHDWTDGLVGLACLEVGVYMLVDRVRQHRQRPAPNDSLKGCIESSLNRVNHQIWLLKNIFWWYLLPIIAALGISMGVSAWHSRQDMVTAVAGLVFSVAICGLVYWGVYWLNQFAVRKELEPRRQELENLLNGLK